MGDLDAMKPEGDLVIKILRKEVIHRQLPLPVPCYDFAPVTDPTLIPANAGASGIAGSLGVTGGRGIICPTPLGKRLSRTLAVPKYL